MKILKKLFFTNRAIIFLMLVVLISCLNCTTKVFLNNPSERIMLNLTESPAYSQAVTWRTLSEISTPQAQIAISTASPDFADKGKGIMATTEIVEIEDKKFAYYHSVVFKSLKPNTLYAYRVGDGRHFSEWNQFKTASEASKPFKFIYLGDPQNKVKSLCSRVFRAAYQKAPDARFWQFTGDIVDDGNADNLWEELYNALGWIPRSTPMILLPGNHGYTTEMVDSIAIRKLNHFWRPQFTLPLNGPKGLEETVYYIDYQGVKLVMLNGNEKIEQQAAWLDSILAINPQIWTIAAIHQPIYSTGEYRDNPHLQKLFIPIFDKYEVDLVLQGHDHTYGRTYKLRNGAIVKHNEKGTIYVVSVSGPKVYSINERYKYIMAKQGTGNQLFQVISVDENKLVYKSYTATGKLYDSFELTK